MKIGDCSRHYVEGQWVVPIGGTSHVVINPATEQAAGSIVLGDGRDVDRAVAAARRAFIDFSRSSVSQRRELLRSIVNVYQRRSEDIARAITTEMGAPLATLSSTQQVATGLGHFSTALELIDRFPFEENLDGGRLIREPVGVCGLITPWNWPMNQISCKVAPALATGCTIVLKPSEVAPFSAHIFAEVLHEAGVPAGVFNLVDGDGAGVGGALVAHPDVDMISFTGSTRAGKQITRDAAETVKRVCLELGGKSPNILLDDCDFDQQVANGVTRMMRNTGQTCSAPSRMLVPADRLAEVEGIARRACEAFVVGDPLLPDTMIGPLASETQFNKVQEMIQGGITEGARLVCGGPGRPPGLNKGYFAQPTVLSDVDNSMQVAREEIFGPVLCLLPYEGEEQAIALANDTPYGLAAYVSSGDVERAYRVSRQLRAGCVTVNNAPMGFTYPFGGYKQSGNGREWGEQGMHEFVELKAVAG